MSKEEMPLKRYEKTGFQIWVAIAVIVGWAFIVICFGNAKAGTGSDATGWSSGLFGDSFGFINAILTAAAFVAVVATYRKERDQLSTMKTEIERANNREEQEKHEALVIDMVRQCMSVISSLRATHYAEADPNDKVLTPDKLWRERLSNVGVTIPLNAACELLLQSDSKVSDYTYKALCTYVDALLVQLEKQWIYDAVKMTFNRSDRSKCNFIFVMIFRRDQPRAQGLREAEEMLETIIDIPVSTS